MLGEYKNIFKELQVEDPKSFHKYIRMDYTMFTEILDRIRPRITKQHTNWRKPLDPGLKLLCTLTNLSGRVIYRHRMFSSRLPHNSLSIAVREVCTAIHEEYETEVVKCPSTAEEWKAIADGFQRRWQFPHCLGTINGKHVAITCPKNGGSMFYNYKGWHSVILMAAVDAD